MMSRKVYKAVAKIINEATLDEKESIRRTLCNEFTELFAEDNPLFSAERFEEACY
jgi:hypothetical protein